VTDAFAHNIRLDQVRDGDRLDLIADEAERASIADRLGIARIDRLEAHMSLSRTGELVRAKGHLTASLDQSCVVTGDPVPAHVDEAFELMFMPAPTEGSPDQEIEIGAPDCDVVFYDGGTIDLGSAVSDTLALSLDPYPRSASAEAALKDAGVMTEEQASPFAILAQLKGRDSNKP
jgi:uncharacterized metal-binding protein YceD (DUF177 family)